MEQEKNAVLQKDRATFGDWVPGLMAIGQKLLAM
jgi:hypothetical protein